MDYYSAVDDIEEEEYEEPNSPQLNIPMVSILQSVQAFLTFD